MEESEKSRARELLAELDKIRGPAELPEWIIKTQTFLVFEAARQHCMGGEAAIGG